MRIISFIIVAALFISCNNSTGVEPEKEFEPYRIGSFMITSPITADYVGINQKAKQADGDTVVINSPGDHGLTLEADTIQTNKFKMTFYDSSLVNGSEIDRIFIDDSNEKFGVGGYSRTSSDSVLVATMDTFYACSGGYPNPTEDLLFLTYREDGSLFKGYKFVVVDFEETIREIIKCD